jgi:hypothetical protein
MSPGLPDFLNNCRGRQQNKFENPWFNELKRKYFLKAILSFNYLLLKALKYVFLKAKKVFVTCCRPIIYLNSDGSITSIKILLINLSIKYCLISRV